MPYISVGEKQPLDLIARRFRRICEKDGLFRRMNFLESYKKPSEIRKLAKEVGKKRAYRRILRDNPSNTSRKSHITSKKPYNTSNRPYSTYRT